MNTKFNEFAKNLIQPPDPKQVSIARKWYKEFTGKYAVSMNDIEILDIYNNLHR